jgi:capsule polysaccharide export protein KpsE/RkpR
MAQAQTREERIRAAQVYWERMGEVRNREEAELKIGRGTVADVAEAQLAHELAALEWIKSHKDPEPADVPALQKRVEALEKRLDRVLRLLERTGGENR